ncbi:Ig-like domain-containing protein, partial [Acinetobacter portensis]
MKDVVVVNKFSLDKKSFNEEKLSLNTASIVHLKVKREDVAEFIQQGNTLIVKLKNGEILTLENFFEKNKENVTSDLVFEDDACAFLWFNYENGIASFKSISGLEELLPAMSTSVFSGMTPWLLGGGAALLGGLAAGGGSGSNDNNPVPTPEVKIINISPIDSSEVGKGGSGSVISGTATPNSNVVVKVNNEILGEIKSDEDGNWEIPTSKQMTELENIVAEIPSNKGNQPQAKDEVERPKISIDFIAMDNVINSKESSLKDGVPLSGFWVGARDDVTIRVIVNGEIYTVNNGLLLSKDGTWNLKVPSSIFNEGMNNNVTAEIIHKLGIGNEVTQLALVDTRVPKVDVNIVNEVDGSGNLNIVKAIFTFDEKINEDSFSEADIKVDGGKLVAGTLKKETDDQWTAYIEFKKGDSLQVSVRPKSYEDLAGNEGVAGANQYISIKINDVVPSKVEDNQDIVIIKGKTEPNKIVSIQLDSEEKIYTTSNNYGEWVVESSKNINEIKKVTATVRDVDNNEINKDEVDLPYVAIHTIAEDDFINLAEKNEYIKGKPLEIKGTMSNPDYPNVVLIVDVEGKKYISNVDPELNLNKDGTWVLMLTDTNDLLSNTNFTVTAQAFGQDTLVISNTAKRTPKIDTKVPNVEVDIVEKSESIAQVFFKFDEEIRETTFTLEDIKVEGGKTIQDSLKLNDDGRWSVDVNYQKGQLLDVSVIPESYTDLAGNVGGGNSDVYISIKIDGAVPSKSLNGKDITIISGKTASNQEVEVTIPGGQVLLTTSNEKGEWKVQTSEPLLEGNTVTAKTKNQDNEVIQDEIKLPLVVINKIAEDDVFNIRETNEYTNGKPLEITGTISNPDYPNVVLVVNVDGKKYTEKSSPELSVNTDGTWVLTLTDTKDLLSNTNFTVTAQAFDQDKLVISNTSERTPKIDINVPSVHVEIIEKNGSSVDAFFTFDEEIDEATFNVSDIKVDGGVIFPESLHKNVDGRWSVEIKTEKGQLLDVSVLSESYTDKAGNLGLGESDQYITIKIESVIPSKDENNQNITKIIGQTAPDQYVAVKIPGGEVIYTKSNSEGEWIAQTNKELIDGNTVVAVTKNEDNKDIQDEVKLPFVAIKVIAEDDVFNINEVEEYSKNKPLVITGTLSNPDYPNVVLVVNVEGAEYTEGKSPQLTVNEDGTWALKLSGTGNLLAGSTINVTAQAIDPKKLDTFGNPIVISNTAERTPVIDKQAPRVTVDIEEVDNQQVKAFFTFDKEINEDSFTVDDIKVDGGVLIPESLKKNDDGRWSIDVKPEKEGQLVKVAVKPESYIDLVGNLGNENYDNFITIKINEINTSKDQVNDKDVTTIKGITAPNQEVVVSVEALIDGGVVLKELTTQSNEDGIWSISTDEILVNGGKISAKTKNQDDVDVQDNTVIPSITVDPITDDNIINLKESSGHDPIITLTGSWSDPKYDVTISVHVNGQTYTVDNGLMVSKDGTWFLNVSASDFLEGGNNSVTAKIINQLGGQNIATQNVEVDTQPPTVTVVVTKDVEATENIAKAIFEFDKEISNKSFTVENIIINGGVLKPETLQRNLDGTWTVDIEYDKGQPLDVSVNTESYKDKAGNIANAIDDKLITLKIESVVPSKENNTSVTIITGQTSAPKQKVVVSLEVIEDDITRTKEIEVISNTDGSWSVTTNEILEEGVPVIAVVKGSNEVSLDQDEFVVPLVVIDVIAKDDVINIQEHAEYREKNVVEITGKLNNSNYPKAALVVTVNDQEYVQGVNSKLTVNEVDGTWTLALPYSEALFKDQDIDVKAYFVDPDKLDSSGKPSIVSNVAERTPEVDVVAPKVKDISISENGMITVQYDSDVDPKSIQSDNIKVTNNKGEVISLEFSVSGDGLTYTAKVPENVDQSINVNVGNGFKDYANNNGEPKSILNQKVETVAPTVIVTLNDDNTVTFKFSEKVKDFTERDVYLSQGQIIDLQQDTKDPTVWTAKIEGRVTDKSLKVSVNDESYTDLAGNLGIGDSDTSDPAYWVKDDNGHSITVKTGLKSEYWGYRENINGIKYDGDNLTSLNQVQNFMSTHTPTVVFETKAFDFELSNYGLGQAGRTKDKNHLITFLGKNAENIEYNGYQHTSDAMIKFTGYMNLNAGSYIFRVTGDDGYQIKVNGKAIVIKDGNQNAKTDYFLVTVTEEDAGWQPVEIYYWDQAERATLKIELAQFSKNLSRI